MICNGITYGGQTVSLQLLQFEPGNRCRFEVLGPDGELLHSVVSSEAVPVYDSWVRWYSDLKVLLYHNPVHYISAQEWNAFLRVPLEGL